MSKKVAEEKIENQEKKTIENLAKELEVKDCVVAGVKAIKGWNNGKEITKAEFNLAISEFLNKTIKKRRTKC